MVKAVKLGKNMNQKDQFQKYKSSFCERIKKEMVNQTNLMPDGNL